MFSAAVRIIPLLALALASGAWAQTYPTKPVTMIVPFAAGGPTDTVARTIGIAMQNALKQTVVVENVGGAGGTLGVARVARATPDGYTILIYHIGMATSPALYRKLPFDPLKDFEYIGLVNEVPMTFIGRSTLQARNFKELLAWIKANGNKVNYGNAGLGAASHLCGLLFMSAIQVDMTTISYKGTAPAMNDLLGGQIDVMCDQTTNTTSQIKGGKVKAYAVTSAKRVPALANLPTLQEEGLKGFEVSIWHALYAPKGTPKPVVDTLVKANQDALKDATVKQRFADLGAEAVSTDKATPAYLQKFLAAEIAKWGPIIKKAGQYAD
ncbi:MAG TPA: tripartite tricarboxylate transporter substrate binding protein BugD [Burkholderiales bacterium]|nr:tripartite tricarboxylate transporter substrate binding protein BugD [Burkholderiales bacterium]